VGLLPGVTFCTCTQASFPETSWLNTACFPALPAFEGQAHTFDNFGLHLLRVDKSSVHLPSNFSDMAEPITAPAAVATTSGGNAAFHNFNNDFAHITDPNERRRLALAEIDKAPFGW
jgi:hypothetical protein